MFRFSLGQQGRFWGASALALSMGLAAMGCAGGSNQTAPAEDPPLPIEEPSEEEVPPSSPEVKAAIEKIKAQQFAEAETILAKAVVDTPEDPQAAFFYAVALEGLGKTADAETQYRRAIELQPKLIEASQNLSALLLAQEKNEEALAVADAALELDPKDAALLGNRALALDMLESPKAVGAYEALLEVAPDDQANRFNYAVALYLNERVDDAKAQLKKIQTADVSLLADMERLYLEMRDPAGCIAMWDSVISKKESAEALTHRARCKLMAKDKAGGQADLKRAIEVEPQSSIAHFYLGKLLQKEGKAAEAKKHFTEAAKAGDDFGKAAQAELSK